MPASLDQVTRWAAAHGFRRTGRGNLALPVIAESRAADANRLTVTITTASVDRHGDIVEPSGADVAAFLRNPVVLWAHDYSRLPIARAVNLRAEPNALIATLEWAPTEFARQVADLYARGYLRGWSIGFRPLLWEEIRAHDNPDRLTGYRFTRWELLELSAVPIPANPDALTHAVAAGLVTHKSLLRSLRRGRGRKLATDQPAAATEASSPAGSGNSPPPCGESVTPTGTEPRARDRAATAAPSASCAADASVRMLPDVEALSRCAAVAIRLRLAAEIQRRVEAALRQRMGRVVPL